MKPLTPIEVIHSTMRWLPESMNWLHKQVGYLPAEVKSVVVCQQTQNPGRFPLPPGAELFSASVLQRGWEWFLRRSGLRPHSEFLMRIAADRRAHVLHSHFGTTAWRDIRVAQRTKLKHFATFYGFDMSMMPAVDRRWLARYRQLFSHLDRVLCEGPHMAERIVELGCPREKVRVHHLGVEVDRIEFKLRRYRPGETLGVLLVATFQEKKGLPFALKALERLSESVPLRVTVIGDAAAEGRSRREKQKILQIVNRGKLGGVTRLLGFQPQEVFWREAYRHHVFLSPSLTASDGDTEGGAPVSLTEMAASGMPIVATTHCDIPNLIAHEKTGLLAREKNVDDLVEHLAWLVNNPNRWEEMTRKGRARVESDFSALRQGTRLASLYRESVEENHAAGLESGVDIPL